MSDTRLPSLDLVVATVDRVEPLERLLGSLESQREGPARLIVVDQNADDRVTRLLAGHRGLDTLHLTSSPGLSRARNVGLAHLSADLVAFPDDDCTYPPGLFGEVTRRFAERPGLDGVTGRAAALDGAADASWASEPATLTPGNLWNRVISFAIFLRRTVVERVGSFDERLGLGSCSPWSSGEEVDYLVRALRAGARIEYDPSLVVHHAVKRYTPAELRGVGRRDGESIGWILRRHGYGARATARMLARPLGGVCLSLARRDLAQAGFQAATLAGRLHGYVRADLS